MHLTMYKQVSNNNNTRSISHSNHRFKNKRITGTVTTVALKSGRAKVTEASFPGKKPGMINTFLLHQCRRQFTVSRLLITGYNFYFPSIMTSRTQPNSDISAFREVFKTSERIAVLTGAGVSAESGIPTFRGSGGFWRTFQAQNLATPHAFKNDPSLVWEFYHYRRELVLTKEPNKAHLALAACQKRLEQDGKKLTLVTQNIDGLHQQAGTEQVIELHGSLFKTQCTLCSQVTENRDSPICPALAGRGAPDPGAAAARIPESELPRCKKSDCGGLLRPHVVWFGEGLESHILEQAYAALDTCDLCLVIGTSSVVYPAAMFAPNIAARGVPVAEFNLETTPATYEFQFYFEGPCGTTVPEALAA